MGDAAAEDRPGSAGPEEWAGRFEQQSVACAALGSPLWASLLRIIRDDVAVASERGDSPSWSIVGERADLRFGQVGPLRLVGAAHRLALSGVAPEWAALLPSCGGVAPADDSAGRSALREAWFGLVSAHRDELVAGLDREVQTNEVGRSAALALAHAVGAGGMGGSVESDGSGRSVGSGARLVEIGCSGGLNLRLDRFRIALGSPDGESFDGESFDGGSFGGESPGGGSPGGGSFDGGAGRGVVLGDPDGRVRLAPEVRSPLPEDLATVPLVDRIGIDPHPIDPTTDAGRLTLLSFVWPDQADRFDRLAAAIELAGEVPATLVRTGDRTTAQVLEEVLTGSIGQAGAPGVATIVQHSIVWQYIPTDQRPAITAVLERMGRDATAASPLVWVRFEPDEWDRTRVAVWVRRWPDGGDRLVAHGDFHGRWIAPVPAP